MGEILKFRLSSSHNRTSVYVPFDSTWAKLKSLAFGFLNVDYSETMETIDIVDANNMDALIETWDENNFNFQKIDLFSPGRDLVFVIHLRESQQLACPPPPPPLYNLDSPSFTSNLASTVENLLSISDDNNDANNAELEFSSSTMVMSNFNKNTFKKLVSNESPVNMVFEFNQSSEFMNCCAKGDVERIEALLNDSLSEEKLQGLFLACVYGHLGVVKVLHEAGVAIDTITPSLNLTPLNGACLIGNEVVAKYLIDNQCEVAKSNKFGASPLHYICFHGMGSLLPTITTSCADQTSEGGFSLAHYAAGMGSVSAVEHLIKVKADINMWDTFGNYPLHYAAASGTLDSVFLLVEVGRCHVDCINENGQTPFLVACRAGNLDVAKWLGSSKAGESTRGGGGANVFVEDKEWCNALHAATLSGNIELLSYVASLGLSVLSKTKDGKIPVDLTRDARVKEVLQKLEAEKFLRDENIAKKNITDMPAETENDQIQHSPTTVNKVKRLNSSAFDSRHMETTPYLGKDISEILSNTSDSLHQAEDSAHTAEVLQMHPDPQVDKLFKACLHFDNNYVKWYISQNLDIGITNEKGSQALHFASQSGNLEAIQLLFDSGADLEVFNDRGVLPMSVACTNLKPDNYSVVKWLATQGAEVFSGQDGIEFEKEPMFILASRPFSCPDLIAFLFQACPLLKYNIKLMNKSDELQWSMLHAAAMYGSPSNIQAFLDIGMKVGPRLCNTGYSVLHCAVLHPRPTVEAVKLILSQCMHDDIVAVDSEGRTAVFLACLFGLFDIVKCIVEAGFDSIAIPNNSGNTCLHVACQNGNNKLVAWIRSLFPNLDVKNKKGVLPQDFSTAPNTSRQWTTRDFDFLHQAFLTGSVDALVEAHTVFELPEEVAEIDDETGYPFLNIMSAEGYIDAISYLVEKGTPLGVLDCRGWSPLHCAAANGHVDLVKYFVLENSMSIFDACGDDGSSCLHLAVRAHHYDMIELLLQLGADANSQDMEGNTPAHLAAIVCWLDVIVLLQDHRADLCLKNGDLMSVLHLAVDGVDENTQLDIVVPVIDQILSFGCDIDIRGKNNLTPFHLACVHGNVELVNYLFESGSNIRLTGGKDGLSALHIAAVKEQQHVAEWLISRGLRLDCINGDNRTPADMAYAAGNYDLYDWLLTFAPNIYADRFSECLVSQLFWSIEQNYTTFAGVILQDFLDSAPSLEYCNDEGSTLMHAAAAVGNMAILEDLFDRGVGIDEVNFNEHLPLHIACLHEHIGCVKALVNLGSDVKAKDADGSTCLHIAVIKDNVDIARLFCVLYDDVDVQNMSGWTPLHYCCYDGKNTEMLNLLLQQNVNIFKYSFDDETPFFLACKHGHNKFVHDMIAHVMKKNVMMSHDMLSKAINIAMENGFPKIASWMECIELENGIVKTLPDTSSFLIGFPMDLINATQQTNNIQKSRNPIFASSQSNNMLLEAVQNEDIACVSALLKDDADPNAFNASNKMSALHLACATGNLMMIQLLVSNGANMNTQNVGGLTPLHICCDRQYEDCAIYLLMMGASVLKLCNNGNSVIHMMASRSLCDAIYELQSREKRNLCELGARNSLGQTALHLAVVGGSVDTCEALLTLGCPIDSTDYDGQTPLLVACCIDNNALVTLLVTRGGNVNHEDNKKKRPLHAACQTGNMLVAHSLIDAAASVNCVTDSGDTLLHVCAKNGKLLLFKWLLKLGLNLETRNSANQTPRDCAVANGNSNIVSWIDKSAN